MYQFYIKGAATFPVELTVEQAEAGKIIPLTNGNLLRVKVSEGIIAMSVLSGTNGVAIGTIYGVSYDGQWIDVATKTSRGTKNQNGASGDWVAGLTELEAIRHANGSGALVIGTPGEFVEVSLRSYGSTPAIQCSLRVEPSAITVDKGELVSFYVYDGMSDATSQEWQVDVGATVVSESHVKIVLGAEKAGSIVRVKMVREYSDGRVCEGEAILTIKADPNQAVVETPAPAEPVEPVNLDPKSYDFKEASEPVAEESIIEPSFRIVSHRKRGYRESEKLSEHFLAGAYDIGTIKEKTETVSDLIVNRKNAYRKGEGVLTPLTVNKSGQWTIEKRPYQGFVRMPFFGSQQVLLQEVKFNGKLLNVLEGHIEDYGILVLTGQALKLGGKLEIKATWIEEVDRGTHEGSETVVKRSDDILREVHRIIGGE